MPGKIKLLVAACLCAATLTAFSATVFDDAKESTSPDWTWTDNPYRQSVCLNGDWDFMPLGPYTGDGSKPETLAYPPAGKWAAEKIRVPASWNNFMGEFDFPKYGGGLHKAWYKRSFVVPLAMSGQRVMLDFKEVSYDANVYVNGSFAGKHRGCFVGFQIDITKLVKPGQSNLLELGVVNWVNAINGNVVEYPINHSCTFRSGILQDVYLRSFAPLRLEDVFVMPSTRKWTLGAKLQIVNGGVAESKITLTNAVVPWSAATPAAQPVKEFAPVELVLKPGERRELELSVPWKDPKLWTPDGPSLYLLRTTILRDGKRLDCKFTRFGFREFYTDGPDFVLNGVKTKLLGNADDTIQATSGDEMASYVRAYYAMLKSSNINVIRAYMPLPEVYLRIADEMGMMVIDGTFLVIGKATVEAGAKVKLKEVKAVNYNHMSYSYHHNEELLDSFFREKTIERRNYPSIIMFCMQNEGMTRKEDFQRKVAVVRQFDGTRPIVSSGAGDSGGAGSLLGPTGGDAKFHRRNHPPDMDGLSAAITQHYPGGYGGCGAFYGPKYFFPGLFYMYDSCYKTLADGSKVRRESLDLGAQTDADENFRRSAADGTLKPLYFSEVPSPDDTPDMIAFIYGNDAYRGVYDRQNGLFHRCAADSGKQQLEIFRYYGAGGVLYFQGPYLSCAVSPNYKFKWKNLDTPGVKPDKITTGGGYLRVNPFNSQTTAASSPGQFAGSSFKAEVIPGQAAYGVRDAFSPLFLHLREADRSFFAGRTIARTVTVGNDTREKQALTLQWRILKDGAPLVSGDKALAMEPGDLVHETLAIKLPALSERTAVKFQLVLADADGVRRQIERDYDIVPEIVPALERPEELKIAAIDADGSADALLGKLNLKREHVAAQEFSALQFQDYGLLVMRYFPGAERRFADLQKYIAAGGKVILLGAADTQTLIPGMKSDEDKLSIAFPLLSGHPILRGISADDLKWWSNPYQVIAYNSFPIPESGNVELLACNGKGANGLNHSPLFLSRNGKGFLLVCNLIVAEAFADTPPARRLAANMLDFAMRPAPSSFAKPGLLAAGATELPAVLKRLQVKTAPVKAPADLRGLSLVIADGKGTPPDKAMVKALAAFVADGGRVLLKNLNPQSLEAYRGLFAFPLDVKPTQLQHSQLELVAEDAALGQVTASDLYWFKNQPIATPIPLEHKIVSWVVDSGAPEARFKVIAREPSRTMRFWSDTANWIEGRAVACAGFDEPPEITSPGAGILKINSGRGFIIIDQTEWNNLDFLKCRTLSRKILLSLNVDFLGDADRCVNTAGYSFLKLEPFFNANSTTPLLSHTGVSFEGGLTADFSEIPFSITASNKSANCVFAGRKGVAGRDGAWDAVVTEAAKTIPVGQKASSLFFLESAVYLPEPNGKVAEYKVNYVDGTSLVVPVLSGRDIGDWYHYPPAGSKAKTGLALYDNGGRYPALFYTQEWRNPKPELAIKSLDVVAGQGPGVLWLMAITASLTAPEKRNEK